MSCRASIALEFTFGTIHLRRRQFLGEVSKICRWIVVKFCRRRGLGVKNSENLPMS